MSINYIFLFSILLMLWPFGTSLTRERQPLPRVSQFLGTANNLFNRATCLHTNQSGAHNPLLYLAATLQEATFLCPNHPRASTRQLDTTCKPQSLLKLFKPDNCEPNDAALSCLSHRSHNKGSCRRIPLSSSTSGQTQVLPFAPGF